MTVEEEEEQEVVVVVLVVVVATILGGSKVGSSLQLQSADYSLLFGGFCSRRRNSWGVYREQVGGLRGWKGRTYYGRLHVGHLYLKGLVLHLPHRGAIEGFAYDGDRCTFRMHTYSEGDRDCMRQLVTCSSACLPYTL